MGMTRLAATSFLLLASLLMRPTFTAAQNPVEIAGVTAQGSMGITIGVEELQRISDATPQPRKTKIREELPINRKPGINPASPAISSYASEPSINTDPSLHATQEPHSNFLGITMGESGSVPPDCMGSVGPTQICVIGNGRVKFYNKPSICDAPLITSTTAGNISLSSPVLNVDLDVFFGSVRNNSGTTDPHAHYDRLSGRWFISCINIESSSNRILLAVSNGSAITNQSSFTFFYFIHDQGVASGQPDYRQFCDFPMMGIDKFAVYIGGLVFNTSGDYQGSSCYVLNKASLLSGGPLTFTAFRRIGTSSTGIFAPQGVDNDDPDATRGYFLGVNAANYGMLNYVVINNPGTTPTSSTGTITVPNTSPPINQVASGSNNPLDGADDRLLSAVIMKNKLTGVSTLWTTHNISVDANGVANGSSGSRNAMRWYELNVAAASITLKQSGTWYDNAAASPRGYWMGSIAMSGQGHVITGASAAGANAKANVIVNGRYSSQAQGQLSNTVNITNYSANYNAESETPQRWGDYSMTEIDPTDNMTIWTFQEYTAATNIWGLRATQFKAPPPATPVSMTPITCTDNKIIDVTLTGNSVDNSGFFDPGTDANGPGFTKRLQVTSTGSVTISNIIFDSPIQIRFRLNFSAAALGSTQTLTITNPDCQSATMSYTLPSTCGPTTVTEFNVFPNPAEDQIQVHTPNATGQVRLVDMGGRVMLIENVTSNIMNLPVARFARGVYVLEYFNNGNQVEKVKVVLR
jgi:hypothetical protein